MSDSKKIDNGGPAFARSAAEHGHGGHYEQDGMSLRDWFAGQALVGMTSVWLHQEREGFPAEEQVKGIKAMSKYSYHIADAMIAARKAGAA